MKRLRLKHSDIKNYSYKFDESYVTLLLLTDLPTDFSYTLQVLDLRD